MTKKPTIGKQSDFIIDSMSYSNRNIKECKLKEINKQHMQDLQFRLDMVAGNAKEKGARKSIGSTLPFDVQAKRQARLDVKNRDNQFKGYRSLTTGQSESYLKNGMYLPK